VACGRLSGGNFSFGRGQFAKPRGPPFTVTDGLGLSGTGLKQAIALLLCRPVALSPRRPVGPVAPSTYQAISYWAVKLVDQGHSVREKP
jgi:hypothetical protein